MDEKEYDGMRYPSIDNLLDAINSKYKLAYAAAMRAKEIEENPEVIPDDVNVKCHKPVGQALEEIYAGKIHIEFKETE